MIDRIEKVIKLEREKLYSRYKHTKGRKDYHCCECQKVIPKGNKSFLLYPARRGCSSCVIVYEKRTMKYLISHEYEPMERYQYETQYIKIEER